MNSNMKSMIYEVLEETPPTPAPLPFFSLGGGGGTTANVEFQIISNETYSCYSYLSWNYLIPSHG